MGNDFPQKNTETTNTIFLMGKDFDRWNKRKKRIDSTTNSPHCHEREVWWCTIGVNVGSEQHSQTGDFSRPVIVLRQFTEDMFWGIPLTTKLVNRPFRVRFILKGTENDALILQMRAFDRKRLVRQIGVVPHDVFAKLITAVTGAVTKTDPARAGSSGAEANVYIQGYTGTPEKSSTVTGDAKSKEKASGGDGTPLRSSS